ncbi:OB-fold nucleic acid binding domain-containing protein [Actinopolymorpha alba]|uniref:OB-fold nucleic acid binding domain-containing protein n=1 Tax=Actinopolymorpha alba TaxID=533267 RepID=UPI0003732C9E|nr:OB-fold nucleic acid binding domain-containing protein [Actinopolymorpha alba]
MAVTAEGPVTAHRNEVLLVGRLSTRAIRRELPSGDVVVGVRVVVERDPNSLRGRVARVDTIECVAWSPECQQTMHDWQPGDVVEISGALRRRFRRTDAGPASRYEVEVERVRRLFSPTADETSDERELAVDERPHDEA